MSMTVFGRVAKATGLSSLRDRAAARLAALRFNPSRMTIVRTSSRPMTDAEWEHFDEAFRQMDIVFRNMDKTFAELRKIR